MKHLLPILSVPLLLAAGVGCVVNEGERINLEGQDILLTMLHTSDIHSRWFPYDLQVGEVDRRLGLVQDNAPFGGASRLAYLLKRERGRAGRCLHVDTGDPFQGAPVFNYYAGEVEIRMLSEMNVDAMVIGNHEFDRGGTNLGVQLERWARFPALAANYGFVPEAYSTNSLARQVLPYRLLNLRGLRVAVIGLGDTGSMHSIFETGNRLGITPFNAEEVAQSWVDFLRPQVDLIVVATHRGLSADEWLIRNTTGIDVVLGGHLHIVLDPPKVLLDCQEPGIQASHRCRTRRVILAHSGAFLKYLGRLDVVVRKSDEDPANGFEVQSHEYTLFPVDSTVPEDPAVARILEPYRIAMDQQINLDRLIGYAPSRVRRFGSEGGDSALGNLVADAMWVRRGIETDFVVTNTTGIRADLDQGPVTTEMLFNVFPFDNTITTMFLSGLEVQELFDYVARRTASRGCASQAQIAGAEVTLNCRGCERTEGLPCAEEVLIGTGPEQRAINPIASYELATNNYLAQGGSGYVMLRRNTTQQDSGIPQRDAVIDRIRAGPPCVNPPEACSTDDECEGPRTCACPGRWRWNDDTLTCQGDGLCTGAGRCVLTSCLDEVAEMYGRRAADPGDDMVQFSCAFRDLAGAECGEIACVDDAVGAAEDGRIRAYLP